MKKPCLELSTGDIKTLLTTLSVFSKINPECDSEHMQIINTVCCESAIQKLKGLNFDITPNEYKIIYSSLVLANAINKGELGTDSTTKKTCLSHLFSINKLLETFDK